MNNRYKLNRGCPYCYGRNATEDNSLERVNPTLASEWHPNRNGQLNPINIKPDSGKSVWWLCKKGHEWKAIVQSRNRGNGCPYCSNKKVGLDNCLVTQNPTLAKEWHLTKNGELTPYDVVLGSNKVVWWLCKNGHEWQASVEKRSKRGDGCRSCKKLKRSESFKSQ